MPQAYLPDAAWAGNRTGPSGSAVSPAATVVPVGMDKFGLQITHSPEQSATKYTGSHLFVCVINPLRANILRVLLRPGLGPLL
jgi:hypothetical protein